MSTYMDPRYGSSLLYPQKLDTNSKYAIPSLSKESSYGYKPDTQSYTNSAANYAARGLMNGVYKPTPTKAQDPLSYMPPISGNYKRTESNMTNYTAMPSNLKPSESILTREIGKRTLAPSPQAQNTKLGGSMVGGTYGKDYAIKDYSGAVNGHVTSAAAYSNDKNMSLPPGQRSGVSVAPNYTRDYSIKDYQGALGGSITGAATYNQEKPIPSAERRFLGISGQIKPQSISSGPRKNPYGYQDNHQEEMLSSPVKQTKDILARSNSKYGEQSYVGYGDTAAERDSSGRLGTGGMANDRSIGSGSRPGEIDKTMTDVYSRKPIANMQSNNYMKNSGYPTDMGVKTYENDTYGRSVTQKTEIPVVKSSAGSWTPSDPKGLVGLRNIGNTCFMNSILQSLFNTPELSDFFAGGKYINQVNHKREKGIARSFADILTKIRSHVGSPSYSAESTYMLKRRIEESNAMFSGYEQHDAQEFLKALLEGIHEDLNRVHEKPAYKELKADVNRPLQTISSEWYDYMLGRDNSIITDLFSGQLLSRTTCTTCGFESLAFDNFWDLSLSFTRGLSMLDGCDLLRMLEQFLKEELLDDLFNCERCKQKRKFKKCFVIWRLPKVLVIHLKRFHYGKYKKEKITQNVRFPVHDLNLTDFVKESKDPSVRDAHYSLFGIVNHSGSLNGGHYTAECMNPFNRKWYNFNDSSVRDSHALDPRDNEAEGESPYILFYVKK